MQLIVALVFLAADKDDAAVRKEMQLLEGNWKVVAQEAKGKKAPEKEFLSNVVFAKPPLDAKKKREATILSFTVDPTKSPKTISAQLVEGKSKTTFTGIYALDGDSLKICLLPESKAPPKEFKTSPNHDSMMMELKREKK